MIECVPNVSEGRDQATIDAIADAVRAVSGVHLLNVHSDADHHRSVFTYASESAAAIRAATLRLFEVALPRIDLRIHHGEHPRVGAVDVVPFVPLEGSTMEECVALAEDFGQEVARRFDLPVYLYENAARHDYRRELPAIRSGEFEQFAQKISDARWKPDFGPDILNPTAGVTVVGARVPLIAFNMQLGTDRMDVARSAARAVRGISGGLRFVRALPIALRSRGIVQVSMNLLDYRHTPIHRAFNLVREEAERFGVQVISSEIVGLVPAEALYQVAEWQLRVAGFRSDMVLEERLKMVTASTRSAEGRSSPHPAHSGSR
ncbi:MAG TPA: glutamate formimidoyltransferase [Thermoanaerobaculia bacterium]|nr:glutamate formimidoyltransferase [Thermoanaerobaculia bacterium]